MEKNSKIEGEGEKKKDEETINTMRLKTKGHLEVCHIPNLVYFAKHLKCYDTRGRKIKCKKIEKKYKIIELKKFKTSRVNNEQPK